MDRQDGAWLLAVCRSALLTMCLEICLFCLGVSSLLAYDRQTLLEIGGWSDQLKYDPLVNFSPCFEEILAFLRRPQLRQRRRRRRGKRGGLRVRLEAHLRSGRVFDCGTNRHFLDISPANLGQMDPAGAPRRWRLWQLQLFGGLRPAVAASYQLAISDRISWTVGTSAHWNVLHLRPLFISSWLCWMWDPSPTRLFYFFHANWILCSWPKD